MTWMHYVWKAHRNQKYQKEMVKQRKDRSSPGHNCNFFFCFSSLVLAIWLVNSWAFRKIHVNVFFFFVVSEFQNAPQVGRLIYFLNMGFQIFGINFDMFFPVVVRCKIDNLKSEYKSVTFVNWNQSTHLLLLINNKCILPKSIIVHFKLLW